jgi:hypothetical protein
MSKVTVLLFIDALNFGEIPADISAIHPPDAADTKSNGYHPQW